MKPIHEVLGSLLTPETRIGRWVIAQVFLAAEQTTCAKSIKRGFGVGAALIHPDGCRIASLGYNGAARGCPHCTGQPPDINEDGDCVVCVHAEHNAILNAAFLGVQTRGLICVCTRCPCYRCAVALHQAGVREVIYFEHNSAGKIPTRVVDLGNDVGLSLLQYPPEMVTWANSNVSTLIRHIKGANP